VLVGALLPLLQEAFYIYQELADKYNETPLLLNGMAVCKMHMGSFDEAEKYLLKVSARGLGLGALGSGLKVRAQGERVQTAASRR